MSEGGKSYGEKESKEDLLEKVTSEQSLGAGEGKHHRNPGEQYPRQRNTECRVPERGVCSEASG